MNIDTAIEETWTRAYRGRDRQTSLSLRVPDGSRLGVWSGSWQRERGRGPVRTKTRREGRASAETERQTRAPASAFLFLAVVVLLFPKDTFKCIYSRKGSDVSRFVPVGCACERGP